MTSAVYRLDPLKDSRHREARSARELEDWLGWVEVDANGCWLWTGLRLAKGYGHLRVEGRNVLAHRFFYELAHGSSPDGMHVLHRCDNPPCCNPAHLVLGTHADNMGDMAAKGRAKSPLGDLNKAKTHCPRGHAYDETNTYVGHHRSRQCRACQRERMRVSRAAKRV